MRKLLRERRRLVAVVAVPCLLLVVGLTALLLSPRTQGLEGDWSAKALDGTVVAGRALLSGDHTALDLRTGKTVSLGSVRGGTPYVADDRLVIASAGRVDSARLDATTRWTWQAPAGETATPVAASGGATLVLSCSAKGACRLVGLDSRGRESWSSEGTARRDPLPAGALPRVDAMRLGDGVLVTDPASGRAALQPARTFAALPDGHVVTEVVQDGKCVIAAYLTADPAWTEVLPTCPVAAPPRLSIDPLDPATLAVAWPSTSARLDLATGMRAQTPAEEEGRVIRRAGGLTAIESRESLRTNPFRWGSRVTVVQLIEDRTGRTRGQVVSDDPLELLLLDAHSVVVRDGDQVTRYTF